MINLAAWHKLIPYTYDAGKVKNSLAFIFLNAMALIVYSQSTETDFVASVSTDTRLNLVKTNIPLSEWHEKAFWVLYNDYLHDIQKISSLTYGALRKLAQTDNVVEDHEAFENGSKIISCRFSELAVRREYFVKISHKHNGIIGFQFLQTEAMLDVVESARIYDQSPCRNFRFLSKALSAEELGQSKYKAISSALALSSKEANVFFPIYSRYEQECEDIMGEGRDLYELFSVEVADLTPAVSKKYGYTLLLLMDKEIKLKEKYFNEVANVVGATLAARFLAWEDYYSITCKMMSQLQ